MRAALVVLLLSVAASAAPPKSPQKARPEAAMSRVEEVKTGRFKAAVPKDWRVTKAGDGAGLQATGPAGTASAVYYAKGNPYFKDAAAFIARQTAPSPIPVAGEKTGPVEDVTVAGRRAKRVARTTFEVTRAPGSEPKEVPFTEEVSVLAGKDGFWVLTLRAPSASWAKNAAPFKTFRDGFQPAE